MNIAFYAPMKPPTSPRPSGDRTIARLLIQAIRGTGASVDIASRVRSFMAKPDNRKADAISRRAARAVDRLAAEFGRNPPDLWFTYHLYHKAPDLLGPGLCQRFRIPYVVAEASLAPKQANGPWAAGHRLVQSALEAADHIFFLNRQDEPCVLPVLKKSANHSRLPPFLNVRPQMGRLKRRRCREALAQVYGLNPTTPWLLAVGMLRPGDKTESYRALAKAMRLLQQPAAQLLIVGDGESRHAVEQLFSSVPVRTCFMGRLSAPDLRDVYAASDVYVWPAIGEAVGMATLEAMAAGLPVVSGPAGAVSDTIDDGVTGFLAKDTTQMAERVQQLMDRSDLRQRMGENGYNHVAIHHSMAAVSTILGRDFSNVLKRS